MLKVYGDALETCAFCPNLCLHSCPVSNAEKKSTLSPWAKMSLVQWVREGLVPLNQESADVLYKCTGCGACQSACLHKIDVPQVLFAARSEAQSRGLGVSNAEVLKPSSRAMERVRRDQKPRNLQGKIVYWPGCKQSLEDDESMDDTLRVLEALTGSEISLGPAVCCGESEVSNGRPEVGMNEGVALGYTLAEAEKIYVGVGACHAHLLRAGVAVESHLPFILKKLLAEPGRIQETVKEKVAIFEGCHHLRQIGMSDQVVALASRIAEGGALELRWCGDSSHCCGAGGGYAQTSPQAAADAGELVLQMAKDTGATIVTTFDAECAAHLMKSQWPEGLRVVPGMTLLAEAMGLKPGEGSVQKSSEE